MQVRLRFRTLRHSICHDTKSEDSGANGGKAHVVNQRNPEIFGPALSGEKQIRGYQEGKAGTRISLSSKVVRMLQSRSNGLRFAELAVIVTL